MRDPHVARLHFTIGSEEGTAYRDPPPLNFTNPLGEFETLGNALTVEPAVHFATEEEARTGIEPFLRSWEIDADLRFDLGTIRFSFERAELIDRDPPPPGSHVLMAGTARFTVTVHPATLTITRRTYPPPPTQFGVTVDVQIAYQRWRNVRLGREPLLGMAYWLLTVMSRLAGNPRAVAAAFNVDQKVLKTLGELSSTRGDLATARKVSHGQRPLSGQEQSWLEKTVKVLILRIGQTSPGTEPRLSMKDLPPL
jgi:hypothetical protein